MRLLVIMHPHPTPPEERDALDLADTPRVGLSSCLPLLDALPDAMVLVDREGRIVHANPTAVHLFLIDLEALRGEPVEALLPPRLRDRYTSLRNAYLSAPTRGTVGGGHELTAARGDGTEFYAEILLSPLTLHEGDYVLADVRDVTERRRAETKMQQHADEMEEFAEAVTHDLKAPLTGIQWLVKETVAQVGRDPCARADHEGTQDLLEKIQRSAGQMRDLIDGLLQMARFGADTSDGSSADAREIVEGVKATFGPSADQRSVRIDIGDIDAAVLPIAGAHLRQILHNLVGNAVKFAPAGTGRIRVELREHFGPHGERVAWLITDDNGPGVPDDDRDRVFRVFQRGRATGTDQGLGLGLSLVRKVAAFYGGRTWVTDSPLGGARFVVEIPISVPVTGARAGLHRITGFIHDRQRQQASAAL